MRKAFLTFCTALILPATASGAPYEIPARWVEEAGLKAAAGSEFGFQGIGYFKGLGILVSSDALLLRIDDSGSPHVTLGLDDLAAGESPAAAWSPQAELFLGLSGGELENRRGFLLVNRNSDWQRIAGPRIDDAPRGWRFTHLEFSGDGTLWAVVRNRALGRSPSGRLGLAAMQWLARIYTYDGKAWTESPLPLPFTHTAVSDLCSDGEGLPWLVATAYNSDRAGAVVSSHAMVMHHRGGIWRTFVPPAPKENSLRWQLESIACRPSGGPWLLGHFKAKPAEAAPGMLGWASFVYERTPEGWRRHLGAKAEGSGPDCRGVRALAIDEGGKAWAACSSGYKESDRVVRFEGSGWVETPLPRLPSARYYHLRGIAFDGRGRGWAFTNVGGDAETGSLRGVLLGRQAQGDWQEKGWNWSRMRQRWFGLVGALR